MTTKNWKNGTLRCRTYNKNVGAGWEVGVICGGRLVFVSNFIHRAEATRWYGIVNKEIRTFSKRFKVGKSFPKTWFTNFLGDHLYHRYYNFLDTVFSKHKTTFRTACNSDVRKYRRLTRNWTPSEKKPFLKAA